MRCGGLQENLPWISRGRRRSRANMIFRYMYLIQYCFVPVRLNLRRYRGIQKILKSYRSTRICKFSRQKCCIYKFSRQKCRIYKFSRQKMRF